MGPVRAVSTSMSDNNVPFDESENTGNTKYHLEGEGYTDADGDHGSRIHFSNWRLVVPRTRLEGAQCGSCRHFA